MDEIQVRCDECSRWAYLDETDFKTQQEADLSTQFVRSLCTQRVALRAEIDDALTDAAGLREQTQRLQEDLTQQKARSDQSQTERDQQRQAEREDTHAEIAALRDLVHSLQEQLARLKAKCEQGQAVGDQQCLDGPLHSQAVGQDQDSSRRDTQDSGNEVKQDAANCSVKSNANMKKPRKKQNYHTPAKEILVCGDGNAARIAKALRQQMKGELSVETRFRRGATIATAQHLLQRYCDEAGKSEILVILHAGVSDANKSAEPAEVAQMERERIIPYAVELVICSVPETTSRGKEAQARCREKAGWLKTVSTISPRPAKKGHEKGSKVQSEAKHARQGMAPRATDGLFDSQHYISGNDIELDWRRENHHTGRHPSSRAAPTPATAGTQHWGYRYGPLRQMLNLYPGIDLFRMVGDWVHHHMSIQRPLQQQ
ncbi:hypothetical protein HPB49_009552 [Dermacentor silvarum]|uniref:Uncharacterized protein n=1 Tax=Dermacentor silvarum TaxID=543639 RepID=A0ACB8DZH5_DERSI|nr:hypothetical protein HPB49_009552 [Dermacentor silvarum]